LAGAGRGCPAHGAVRDRRHPRLNSDPDHRHSAGPATATGSGRTQRGLERPLTVGQSFQAFLLSEVPDHIKNGRGARRNLPSVKACHFQFVRVFFYICTYVTVSVSVIVIVMEVL